jgi:hypothetical protein
MGGGRGAGAGVVVGQSAETGIVEAEACRQGSYGRWSGERARGRLSDVRGPRLLGPGGALSAGGSRRNLIGQACRGHLAPIQGFGQDFGQDFLCFTVQVGTPRRWPAVPLPPPTQFKESSRWHDTPSMPRPLCCWLPVFRRWLVARLLFRRNSSLRRRVRRPLGPRVRARQRLKARPLAGVLTGPKTSSRLPKSLTPIRRSVSKLFKTPVGRL